MRDRTILLVGDETEILDLAVSVLSDAGYRPRTAPNGDVALIILQQRGISFDLLITDVMMPGELDGFALARETRELFPEMPIIYLSGFGEAPAARSRGAPRGEILPKPWSPDRLLGSVEAALEGMSMEERLPA
jgi:DNA-binding NtrC family response regulator